MNRRIFFKGITAAPLIMTFNHYKPYWGKNRIEVPKQEFQTNAIQVYEPYRVEIIIDGKIYHYEDFDMSIDNFYKRNG